MEGGWRWYATSATCIRTSEKFQKNHKCSNKNIKKHLPVVIGQPFKNQRTPANPWRHLWGRMQVCCIYQGQACILVNFREKNRHKDGQNMKVKEESICVSFFGARILSHSQFCLSTQRTSTNCDSNQESRTGKQQLWNFQVPSIQSLYMYFVIIY